MAQVSPSLFIITEEHMNRSYLSLCSFVCQSASNLNGILEKVSSDFIAKVYGLFHQQLIIKLHFHCYSQTNYKYYSSGAGFPFDGRMVRHSNYTNLIGSPHSRKICFESGDMNILRDHMRGGGGSSQILYFNFRLQGVGGYTAILYYRKRPN